MNCASIDLKAYFLDETPGGERRAVEQHLASCAACREELERLSIMRSALLTVRDEEMPRRIAFVSDKVFQPRWYERLWNSGPKLGFVSAMMLACALFVHAFYAPAAPVQAPVAAVSDAEIDARVEAAVNARLDAAIAKAVAATRADQSQESEQHLRLAVAQIEQEMAADRVTTNDFYTTLHDQLGRLTKFTIADASLGGGQ